ncbi:NAD(P)-binding domain-containing protein [uncultured Secundilactobacillus sp.]|uniref:NAD(P)-binding domain-containing protein n=1 Tax=uncultured Secundilactobacillus sp. TaxID=2813935 RepID=UPI0025840C07|nr:NAD(P)-binding domain-containing protein [uncultured Secundilactobacillus sp.]
MLSSAQILEAQYVFIGIGDFSYPYRPNIPGNNYGIHYADIQTYQPFSNQMQTVIGGNEAGFDGCDQPSQAWDSNNHLRS